jgi:hypothetical protein
MVYVDRGLQYRKVGNVTGGDGDYIEVPVPGGLGSLIRFDAALVDRFVTVVSNGVVAERPDGSMTAMIENVQGQIDQIVPTVAALAGVPETNFQISPNSVDLKQFGDKVIEQETIINLMKTVPVTRVKDQRVKVTFANSNPGVYTTQTFSSIVENTGSDTTLLTVGSATITTNRPCLFIAQAQGQCSTASASMRIVTPTKVIGHVVVQGLNAVYGCGGSMFFPAGTVITVDTYLSWSAHSAEFVAIEYTTQTIAEILGI